MEEEDNADDNIDHFDDNDDIKSGGEVRHYWLEWGSSTGGVLWNWREEKQFSIDLFFVCFVCGVLVCFFGDRYSQWPLSTQVLSKLCECVCVCVSTPRWAVKPLLVILTQFSQTHSDHGNGPRRYLLIWGKMTEIPFLLLQKHSLSPDVPWERVALALVKIVFIVTQNMFLQIIYFADIWLNFCRFFLPSPSWSSA